MTNDELWLYTLCKKNGVFITDIEISLLTRFKTLLIEWNKKINLISRKNEDTIWKNHIAVSLSLLFKIDFSSPSNILDLGTGGGFPGIPLSIILKNNRFVLLDSTQKKIIVVQSILQDLKLPNVTAIWGRAEEIQKQSGMAGSFDIVVARSVSNLPNLLEWGLPFLRDRKSDTADAEENSSKRYHTTSPFLVTFKGGEIDDEEKIAKRKFPKVKLRTIPLIFEGSEEFENQDRKLIVATTTHDHG